jgi:hypothetical protein
MKQAAPLRVLLLGAIMLLLSTTALADEARISDLSYLDRQYMSQQRELLGELAALELGRRFNGTKSNDLEVLQLLLDRRLVRPGQTRELQAMGVVMGDLLAAELDMHWVVYEDRLGRSRALRYRQSDEYLFPITMISRRQEVDNRTPVTAIYQKAYEIIAPLLPARPFR